MTGEKLKLLGSWVSAFVLRPRIALNLKGLDYEYQEEDLGNKSELLLKSNPVYKKIPVLLHGDKPICESLLIVQYIDDVWHSKGSPILPKDPHDRAVARFWGAYIDDKWIPSLGKMIKAPNEEERMAAKEEVDTGLQLLEEALEGKKFFSGDSIGYVDIALGCCLGWVRASEEIWSMNIIDDVKTTRLAAWAEAFCSDDAVMGVMPETQKLVELFKAMLAKGKGNSS